jgi:hypothetical protein
MGGRKLFNGLAGISADLLRSALAPYSLSFWERECVVVIMKRDQMPMSYLMLSFVDAMLEADQDIIEEGGRPRSSGSSAI